MATIEFYKKNTGANLVETPAIDGPGDRLYTQRLRIDTSEKNIAATGTDTGTIIPVAPYMQVEAFSVEVITAEGATATADFGISGDDITNDPNGLDDAVNLNATAGTITFGAKGTDAGLSVNFGASGGFITIVADNALDTAVFDVCITFAKVQTNNLLG